MRTLFQIEIEKPIYIALLIIMAKQKNVSHTQINLSEYLKALDEIIHYMFNNIPSICERNTYQIWMNIYNV